MSSEWAGCESNWTLWEMSMHSERVLNEFWMGSEWIFNKFWMSSAWILNALWMHCGWTLNAFWMSLKEFRTSSARVLTEFGRTYECALNISWLSSEYIADGLWRIADWVINEFWMTYECVLTESWVSSQWILNVFRMSFGMSFWINSAWVLNKLWTVPNEFRSSPEWVRTHEFQFSW